MPMKFSGASASSRLKSWLLVSPPGSGVPVPGAKGRVQAVDVQRQIARAVADAFANRLHHRQQAVAVPAAQGSGGVDQAALVLHIFPGGALAAGAQADLHGAPGVHQLLLNGFVSPGAVAAGFAEMVFPGVAMRVEIHQGQRAMALLRRTQQRQRDRMVAAQKHHVVTRHQGSRLPLDMAAHLGQRRSVGEAHVACIAKLAERRHIEIRVNPVAQHRAGPADFLRAEARARPVGYGAVEGHARNGKGVPGLQGRRGQEADGVVGIGELAEAHEKYLR